jgi:hypothetical protein
VSASTFGPDFHQQVPIGEGFSHSEDICEGFSHALRSCRRATRPRDLLVALAVLGARARTHAGLQECHRLWTLLAVMMRSLKGQGGSTGPPPPADPTHRKAREGRPGRKGTPPEGSRACASPRSAPLAARARGR